MPLKPCPAPSRSAVYSLVHERWIDPWKGVVYTRRDGRPIPPSEEGGYVRVTGDVGGKPSTIYGHKIIWESVYGPVPEGHHIDHLNGKKYDNRIGNLEPVLPRENALRAIRKGLAPTGSRVPSARLTAEQVCEIRRTRKSVSGAEWARRLGVDPSTINAIRRGDSWRHVVCHRDGTASACPNKSEPRKPPKPRRRKSEKGGPASD